MNYPTPGSLELVEEPSGNWMIRLPAEPFGLREPPAPSPRIGETAWYVPYTAVHPLTAAGAPRDAVWVNVASSPNSYYGALARIWARGETFAILEHDVICRPDVIDAFESCPEPWCCFGYHDVHDELFGDMLGCTRFRAEVLETVPDALSSLPEEGWDWHCVCDGLGRNIRTAGFTHHLHRPPVVHHHLT